MASRLLLGFSSTKGKEAREGDEDCRDWNGECKREAAEAATLDELRSVPVEAVPEQARELATGLMKVSGASAARLDGLLRETMLEAGRRGLERALEDDCSDCGAANVPRCGCGGRMRQVHRLINTLCFFSIVEMGFC